MGQGDMGTRLSELKEKYKESGIDFGMVAKEMYWQWGKEEDDE